MRIAIIIAGILLALTTGCRIVENTQRVSLTAGNDIIYKSEAVQEGTQAADKEVGDISPSTTATVKPGL